MLKMKTFLVFWTISLSAALPVGASFPFKLHCSNREGDLQASFFYNGGNGAFNMKDTYDGKKNRYRGTFDPGNPIPAGTSYTIYKMSLELDVGTFENGSTTGKATFALESSGKMYMTIDDEITMDCSE